MVSLSRGQPGKSERFQALATPIIIFSYKTPKHKLSRHIRTRKSKSSEGRAILAITTVGNTNVSHSFYRVGGTTVLYSTVQ